MDETSDHSDDAAPVEEGAETNQRAPTTESEKSGEDDNDEEEDEVEASGDSPPAASQLVPTNPNVAAEAAIAAAYRGHASVDEAGLMIDGVEFNRKRKRDASDEEQDKVHETLYDQVYKLAKKLKSMRDALNQAKTLLEPFGDESSATVASSAVAVQGDDGTAPASARSSVATDATAASSSSSSSVMVVRDTQPEAETSIVVAGSEADVTSSTTPRAYVLAPSHKHAFLNRVRLCVESWTNKAITVEQGGIVNCPNDSDFPHRLRWEKSGPPMRWVETSPRKTNLVVSMRSNTGVDGALMDDEAAILRHANALLPQGHPKLTELRFVCYLVHGDADNGYDPKSRPHTSLEKSMFKNPSACVSFHDGGYVSSFFHHGEGAPPVTKYNATMQSGKVIFKDICFSDKCLTSNTLNETEGVWRLCIRSTHPGLSNLINFSVLTPPFCTGRRVRAVKVRQPKKSAAGEAAAADES